MLPLLLALLLSDPASAYVRILGKAGIAHGCVVEGVLLTNEHVILDEGLLSSKYVPVTWSDQAGREGIATVDIVSSTRDIALLATNAPVGAGLRRAELPPKVGDKLWVWGYSLGDKNPFKENKVKVEVAAVSSGHILFSPKDKDEIGPGFSGGCICNEKDEAVGIVWMGWTHGPFRTLTVFGVGIWGAWNPLPEASEAP